jgi:anti-sigma factor RsiW
MSSLEMRHPEDGQLLRHLDGELPRGKANQLRTHLEACWQCRTEVEELQAVVGDCVRYRKNVLAACLPPPPAPWRALDFERADAELAAQSIFSRLANLLSPRRNGALRWAISGAAVLALGPASSQLRETPKVEAAVRSKEGDRDFAVASGFARSACKSPRTGRMTPP